MVLSFPLALYRYPFSLPPFYIAIIRCLGVLEGLAIQVDPKARVISAAYPYVASRVSMGPHVADRINIDFSSVNATH